MSLSEAVTAIDVKQAIRIAADYLCELLPTVQGSDVSVEEVERAAGQWLITLGFSDPRASDLRGIVDVRVYKQFKIDARNGEVLAMLMRQP